MLNRPDFTELTDWRVRSGMSPVDNGALEAGRVDARAGERRALLLVVAE